MILKNQKKYLNFILSLNKNGDFKFTKNSQICSFSLCFAIFGLNLLNQKSYIEKNKIEWNKKIKITLLIIIIKERFYQIISILINPFYNYYVFRYQLLKY